MDRRRLRRKRARLPVQVEPGGITSFTGDLGSGGIFLYSSRIHKPGTRVRLVLRTSWGPIEADGVVRWAKRVPVPFMSHVRGGMGIEFTRLSPEFEIYLTEIEAPIRAAV